MDDRRVGRVLREVRIRLGLRQRDLSVLAGVSAAQISAAENGRLEHVSLTALRKLGDALDIRISIDAWWRSGRVDQLLDRVHAALVEYLVRLLRALGWEVRVEVSFNEFGDRGSVDVLAWHAATRTLLVGEVKSRIDDVQDLGRSFTTKQRLVPAIVARDLGWAAHHVTSLLAIVDTRQNRDDVRTHEATLATIWPERSAMVRRHLADPRRPLAGGILFVPIGRLGASARTVKRVRRAVGPVPPAPEAASAAPVPPAHVAAPRAAPPSPPR